MASRLKKQRKSQAMNEGPFVSVPFFGNKWPFFIFVGWTPLNLADAAKLSPAKERDLAECQG